MKCSNCNFNMKKVLVRIEGARNKVLSYQCNKCGYFDFEKRSAQKTIHEIKLKENTQKIN